MPRLTLRQLFVVREREHPTAKHNHVESKNDVSSMFVKVLGFCPKLVPIPGFVLFAPGIQMDPRQLAAVGLISTLCRIMRAWQWNETHTQNWNHSLATHLCVPSGIVPPQFRSCIEYHQRQAG